MRYHENFTESEIADLDETQSTASRMRKLAAYCALLAAVMLGGVAAMDAGSADAAGKAERGWHGWVQTSAFGPYEGEFVTATGRRIGYRSRYVAVPIGQLVSKKAWKKLSGKRKRTRFYFHQKLVLKRGKRKVRVSVEDVGGFGSYGGRYKGAWRKRQFDLTPGAFRALGLGSRDCGFVKWRYA